MIRLRRGTWQGYLFLAMALLLFLTFLPYVILGEWETAREASGGFAALITGWVLRGWHDAEKLRRRVNDRVTVYNWLGDDGVRVFFVVHHYGEE